MTSSDYMTSKLIVFTDLDGTLLDHFDYSFQAASTALTTLKTLGIPCVINTSKTYSELLSLRQDLRHRDPFITENGAAVYLPKTCSLQATDELQSHGDYWVKAFGPSRVNLIELALSFKDTYDFTCYSELTPEQLAEYTGLDLASASLSLQREFTEPLIWNDSQNALESLKTEMAKHGVKVQKGGRFVHLMGEACDKAVAMEWLNQQYQDKYQEQTKTIALGDGENDVGMIGQANIPVVVRSPVHIPPEIPNRSDVWITESYGPTGWSEAINKALATEGYV
ncbi:HAD-IIB family hydrolase [Rhodanobacter aciditrophus]|uniref:HAD-IIB family hydrolase n=1 Tax=Rhodanobacter aciditrophus TaxID=1623218 RepID=A0ABW4AZB5_9GAMM